MSALLKVPDELSRYVEVREQWQNITNRILHGEGFSPKIWQHIDELISDAQQRLANRSLKPEYDWESDIRNAQNWHHTNRDWAEAVSRQLEATSRIWEQMAENAQKFAKELGLAGIKFAFLAHGAVGLGCLAVLGQKDKEIPSALLVFCIICALVGIGLLAIGGVIMVEVAPTAAGHIRHKMATAVSFKKFRRLGRVWERKIFPKLQLANYFFYGSILWLMFYVFAGVLVLLVNSAT
jgi:hypothetical protein